MLKFLLWLVLLVMCWPLALLALVLYPLVWVVLLPFGLSASRSTVYLRCCVPCSCCPRAYWAGS